MSATSTASPEQVLLAARDFTLKRAELWRDVYVEHMTVHDRGDTRAEVTEGNPWGPWLVWERLRYDWSEPGSVRAMVVASNLFRSWQHLGDPRRASRRWEPGRDHRAPALEGPRLALAALSDRSRATRRRGVPSSVPQPGGGRSQRLAVAERYLSTQNSTKISARAASTINTNTLVMAAWGEGPT